MKLIKLIVIELVSFLFVPSIFAHQIDSKLPDDDQSETKLNSSSSMGASERLERTVQKLQRVCDIVRRESLQLTSRRELQNRCGRYWVDSYSQLISPSDREVGIWGIETMDEKQLPNRSIRK